MRNLSRVLADIRAGKTPPPAAVCKDQPGCAEELRLVDRRIGENRTHLATVESDLARMEKAYAPIQAKNDAVLARANQVRKAVGQLKSGLRDWVAVHKSLGDNVRRGLQPNIRQLVATATDLKKLVDDMRKAP